MLKLVPVERLEAVIEYLKMWASRAGMNPVDVAALTDAAHCMERELDVRHEVAEYDNLKVSSSGLLEAVEGIYGCYEPESTSDDELQQRCLKLWKELYDEDAWLQVQEKARGRCRVIGWFMDGLGIKTREVQMPWEEDRRQALLIFHSMLRAKKARKNKQ